MLGVCAQTKAVMPASHIDQAHDKKRTRVTESRKVVASSCEASWQVACQTQNLLEDEKMNYWHDHAWEGSQGSSSAQECPPWASQSTRGPGPGHRGPGEACLERLAQHAHHSAIVECSAHCCFSRIP